MRWSVVERVTTITTQAVVGASEDLVEKIKDMTLDHGALAVMEEAPGRLGRRKAVSRRSDEARSDGGRR